VGIDLWVLLFALFVSVVTGLLFGSLPALQVTRQDLAPTLKEGGSRTTLGVGGNRVRSLLVVLQVAASFVLLVGAGLTLRSAMKLQHVDTGVDPEHLLTATITLPYTKYPDEPPMRVFFRRLIDQLATHPGVLAVAVSNDNPLGNAEAALNPNFKIEGQPTDPRQQQPQGSFHMVTPEYFHTLRIPMIEGRTFTLRDVAKAPLVAVVNQSLARQYFPNQSPLGHRIALTNQGGGMWCTIVGVVGDVKQHGVGNAAGPGIYYTWEQAADGQGELLVRTSGDPLGLVGDVRAAVHGLDQEQPITNVQTLDQMRSGEVAPARLTATLLGLFALLAFVITATGVSAVIAFFVSERTQEIGIRSALGADRGDVVALVLRQAMGLVALGLGVGAVVALMLTGLLRSLLFDVEPTDPLTFVLIAAMLLAVVAIACMVPARRAMRIDPVVALRS
jgi:putative ABC transport system permease protein